MFRKIFTPLQANHRLPLVKKIVTEILEKGQALRKFLEWYHGQELPQECAMLETEIEALITELEELGCYFKDWNFEIGLVDFPAQIHGQDVLLCWRSDEPFIRWYHTIDDGYPGRRLIPEDVLEE